MPSPAIIPTTEEEPIGYRQLPTSDYEEDEYDEFGPEGIKHNVVTTLRIQNEHSTT